VLDDSYKPNRRSTATSRENAQAAPSGWSGKLLALGNINSHRSRTFLREARSSRHTSACASVATSNWARHGRALQAARPSYTDGCMARSYLIPWPRVLHQPLRRSDKTPPSGAEQLAQYPPPAASSPTPTPVACPPTADAVRSSGSLPPSPQQRTEQSFPAESRYEEVGSKATACTLSP